MAPASQSPDPTPGSDTSVTLATGVSKHTSKRHTLKMCREDLQRNVLHYHLTDGFNTICKRNQIYNILSVLAAQRR